MTNRIDRRQFLVVSGATAGLAAVTPRPLRAAAARGRVVGLKADYLDRPLGLENRHPNLSWRLESSQRNVRQSAYRIRVASSEEALKAGKSDLWDSGKVHSAKCFGIPYQGRELTSRERCWWNLQIWNEHGKASAASSSSWWEMGLLHPADWNAQWLAAEDTSMRADRELGLQWIWGPPKNEKSTRLFRLKFRLPADSRSGEIFPVANDAITTAAVKGVWLDGVAVKGDTRLNQGRSIANTTVSLSGQRLPLPGMNAGEHLIAVEVEAGALPEGMTQGFACLARFVLVDGAPLRIGSGPHWKTRLAHADRWYTPEYDDTSWEAAQPAPIDFLPLPPAAALNLRKSFSLDRQPLRARLYATALGAYEARLNGQRVGDALLTPEISQYAKRVLYRVFDVTKMLQVGRNAIGLIVADGWYASWDGVYAWGPPPRRALAQLEMTFADGTSQIVGTGPGWRIAQSAIQSSQIRIGEVYDARLHESGWDRAHFDDSHWEAAEPAVQPSCQLTAHAGPPIRATQVLKPVAITQPRPGAYVFDFGQNFPGWCRLHARGPRGTRIELEFAELLQPSGELEQGLLAIGELKKDVFILKGDKAEETFEPHFTYRGFRYVQVTGLTAAPTLAMLEGIVAHSDLPLTGRLRIDTPLIQQTWLNTVWTQRSNFVSIPTDCPSREQRGWMGDAGAFWDAAAYNMDVHAFTVRHMENVRDDQHDNGEFAPCPPEPPGANSVFVRGAGSVWGDGGVILPWTVWRRYGDLGIIEQNWNAMNRYLHSILERNPDYVSRNRSSDIGDHLALRGPPQIALLPDPVPTTPVELVSTAYWAYSARLLAQMAQATGRTQEAERLASLFERVRLAFNDAFVKPDGTVGIGTQCGYILALQFEMLPQELRRRAAERLVADIRRRGIALTTGIVGTQFSLDVLVEAGFADLAYGLLLRTAAPSWGYMLRNGATTIWESWNGKIVHDGQVMTVSQNHYAFGSICGFLFRRVAGIDAASPGFQTISIRPVIDSRVKSAGGDFDSIMGRISTDWEQSASGQFKLNVSLPANTSARIHVPASRQSRINEGRTDISRRSDMRLVGRLENEAIVEVGSGEYQFLVWRG